MNELRLRVLSLRYSSWSIRAWLALTHAGAPFQTETVELPQLDVQGSKEGPALVTLDAKDLARRRVLGSVAGLFPVLWVDDVPIHESLAICEWVAEAFPGAALWPAEPLQRARARSVSCEMAAGFQSLRKHMSCHVFARVPHFLPDAATRADIDRVFEIWEGCLRTSSGPFLFGSFSIADCMYFPVLTRFRTYRIHLSDELENYARCLESHPSVEAWRRVAATAPSIPAYDQRIRELGGSLQA